MNYDELFDAILKKDAVKSLIPMTYWDGKIVNPIDSYKSISICTTCMNRLQDLSQTLPKNIEDNKDYEGTLEFVVLDYNSQDGLGDWIKSNMMSHIESGLLVYYRTDEPQSYSMSHSRNVVMKLATGHILNSVDADNFVNKGFVFKINELSHQQSEKAIFLKGRRMLRGRLGYYKSEFIQELAGYNEMMGAIGYGAEDHELMYRACGLGYKLMWFGGDYYQGLPNSPKHQVENFKHQNWRYTEKVNKLITFFNIFYKLYQANVGIQWGKCTVYKNFSKDPIIL